MRLSQSAWCFFAVPTTQDRHCIYGASSRRAGFLLQISMALLRVSQDHFSRQPQPAGIPAENMANVLDKLQRAPSRSARINTENTTNRPRDDKTSCCYPCAPEHAARLKENKPIKTGKPTWACQSAHHPAASRTVCLNILGSIGGRMG